MHVEPASKKLVDQYVASKHYTRRPSIYTRGFALVDDGRVEGVIVYSFPSPALSKHAFRDRDFPLWELSRLVVQTEAPNAASFLVGNSMRQLDGPLALVSYADSEWGHCGIVYQATNWLYTGATVSHDHLYLVDGQRLHAMALRDRGITSPKAWAKENNIQTVKPSPKHRYFQFVGNKREKKHMMGRLKYTVQPYPKCEAVRYDDGPYLHVEV